jgi:lysophospholipase L1-like esterase
MEDSSFVSQLGRLLGENYQVVNAGRPGYSSFQGKVSFAKEISALSPDILLIMFAWNDHWPAGEDIQDKNQQLPPDFIIAIQNQLSRLHSYRLLRKWLLDAIESDTGQPVNKNELVFRVGLADFSQNLNEICRKAVATGAVPILMTSPIAPLDEYSPATGKSTLHEFHAQYNNEIKLVAKTAGVELVDLAGAFEHHTGLFDQPTYDPIHFNAQGHQLAARLILETISRSVR